MIPREGKIYLQMSKCWLLIVHFVVRAKLVHLVPFSHRVRWIICAQRPVGIEFERCRGKSGSRDKNARAS